PQHAFTRRADLPQRAVAASVHRRRSRLEPMAADRREREVEHQLRAVDEDDRAPELRRDREAPLGGAEIRLERSDLKQPDRDVRVLRHDSEAEVLSRLTLTPRPRDEPLEA